MIKDLASLKSSAFIYQPQEGFFIIAGRTSKDNDFISMRVAGPNDYWFHVRGMPGSHVLLRSISGEEPTKNLLELAAGLAVWHSKGRTGGVTAVSMTMAKFVSKPSGVPAGTVSIKNEKVLKVRPQNLPEAKKSELLPQNCEVD